MQKDAKIEPVGLFTRLTPERRKYLTALTKRLGMSVSATVDKLLTEIRKEPTPGGQVPWWLEKALERYDADMYSEPAVFYTRVCPENKQYIELMAKKADVSITIMLEVILWEIQNNDRKAK